MPIHRLSVSGRPDQIHDPGKSMIVPGSSKRSTTLIHPGLLPTSAVGSPAEISLQKNPLSPLKTALQTITVVTPESDPASYNVQRQQLDKDLDRSTIRIFEGGEWIKTKNIKEFYGPHKNEEEKSLEQPLYPQITGLHQGMYSDALELGSRNFSLKGITSVTPILGYSEIGPEKGKKIKLYNKEIQGIMINETVVPEMVYSRNEDIYSLEARNTVYALNILDKSDPNKFGRQYLMRNREGEWELIPEETVKVENQMLLDPIKEELTQLKKLANSGENIEKQLIEVNKKMGTQDLNLEQLNSVMQHKMKSIETFISKFDYQPICNLSFTAIVDGTGVRSSHVTPSSSFEIAVNSRCPELQYTGANLEQLKRAGIESQGITDPELSASQKVGRFFINLERNLGTPIGTPSPREEETKMNQDRRHSDPIIHYKTSIDRGNKTESEGSKLGSPPSQPSPPNKRPPST